MPGPEPLPSIENYRSTTGEELRELYALRVMRALSYAERARVIRALNEALQDQD